MPKPAQQNEIDICNKTNTLINAHTPNACDLVGLYVYMYICVASESESSSPE